MLTHFILENRERRASFVGEKFLIFTQGSMMLQIQSVAMKIYHWQPWRAGKVQSLMVPWLIFQNKIERIKPKRALCL